MIKSSWWRVHFITPQIFIISEVAIAIFLTRLYLYNVHTLTDTVTKTIVTDL